MIRAFVLLSALLCSTTVQASESSCETLGQLSRVMCRLSTEKLALTAPAQETERTWSALICDVAQVETRVHCPADAERLTSSCTYTANFVTEQVERACEMLLRYYGTIGQDAPYFRTLSLDQKRALCDRVQMVSYDTSIAACGGARSKNVGAPVQK